MKVLFHICFGLELRCTEAEYVQTEIGQQDACFCQAIEAILQVVSHGLGAGVLLEQGLDFLLVLEHLQHLPLQLNGTLLQHLVANHHRDLVSQTLAGNLQGGAGKECDSNIWNNFLVCPVMPSILNLPDFHLQSHIFAQNLY